MIFFHMKNTASAVFRSFILYRDTKQRPLLERTSPLDLYAVVRFCCVHWSIADILRPIVRGQDHSISIGVKIGEI
jgi:hypothetical protein